VVGAAGAASLHSCRHLKSACQPCRFASAFQQCCSCFKLPRACRKLDQYCMSMRHASASWHAATSSHAFCHPACVSCPAAPACCRINVEVWGPLAERASQELNKGDRVAVQVRCDAQLSCEASG
jgi:hypothetical protein